MAGLINTSMEVALYARALYAAKRGERDESADYSGRIQILLQAGHEDGRRSLARSSAEVAS